MADCFREGGVAVRFAKDDCLVEAGVGAVSGLAEVVAEVVGRLVGEGDEVAAGLVGEVAGVDDGAGKAFANASMSWPAVLYRFSGDLCNALSKTASIASFNAGLSCRGGGGGVVMCWRATVVNEGASNGNRPTSISYNIIPSEYRSD
jgi:hypothetical protein